MAPTPVKRVASRSPVGQRLTKRILTSSPEEGEVDDPNSPPQTSSCISTQKSSAPPITRVPFPFKKKTDVPSTVPAISNVFDRYDGHTREEKHHTGKNAAVDRWEPPFGRGESLFSRVESHDSFTRGDQGRDTRDRRRSPSRGRYPPLRSRSPGSPPYRSRQRRTDSRTPKSYSPSSPRRSRERAYDRDHRDRRDNDSRWHRRRDISADDRHYRPSSPNDHRRDDRDRDRSRRDKLSYDYEPRSRRDYSSHWSPSRPESPRPSEPVSPRPRTASVESHSPLITKGSDPRPPSFSPPPAPPPDPRISKMALPPPPPQPPLHTQAKPQMQRPNAPKNMLSPASLEMRPSLSTAKAMTHGVDSRIDNPQPQRSLPPLPPQREQIPPPAPKREFKISDHPIIQILRSKPLSRRTLKEEVQFYGHGFTGCGKQDAYETTTKLGEGTFGEVHKAIHKTTGSVVALKRILMHNEKEGMPVTALREIKILKALKHPSIVNILDMFVVRSKESQPLSVYMVFPYMDHDLAGLLENERVKLQPSHIKLYMKQLLEGTAYMHQNHILHRDMKAANLLISNDGVLMIADFGLARCFDPSVSNTGPTNGNNVTGSYKKYTNCVVTRWYRPPELLLGARHYGGEVDIWGIGCVLGEMFTRKPILPGTSDLDQLEKIWYLCGSPNQHNWPYFDKLPGCEGVIRFKNQTRRLKPTYESVGPETVDLLDQLLKINPKERPTAAAALEHEYFWTDPLPADPKTMPSYEASHEFDKRGHHHRQPPAAPAGPSRAQRPGRYGGPPDNSRFNNRAPRQGGPDTRQQNFRPPLGPGGHRPPYQAQPPIPPFIPPNNPNVLLSQPPPNAPMYPGPGGYHGGIAPGFGMVLNVPPGPAAMYGPNGLPASIPPQMGMANGFGPPPYLNGPPYPGGPVPPHIFPQNTHFTGPQPPRRPQGRSRWEQGQRNHNYNNTSLPKPPPGLPSKPMVSMGLDSGDHESTKMVEDRAGPSDKTEELCYG